MKFHKYAFTFIFSLCFIVYNAHSQTQLNSGGGTSSYLVNSTGTHVVYVGKENGDTTDNLYSVSIVDGTISKLNGTLVSGGFIFSFKISNDGATVVYRADQDTDNVVELYSVAIGGGTATKLNGALVSGGIVGSSFSITSDNTTVVYLADQETDGVNEVYTVPIGGGTPSKISGTMGSGGSSNGFVVSDDDSRVVYSADQDTDGQFELYSVSISGGTVVKLNETIEGIGINGFKLSNDSNRVVYRADQEVRFKFEIYSVPIAGGTVVKLNGTLPEQGDVYGTFQITGDSSRVVYHADQDTDNIDEIYSVPIAGGTTTKLNSALPHSLSDINDFSVSSDGSTVVYRGDQETLNVVELFSVSVTGGTPTKLSTEGITLSIIDYIISGDSNTVVYRTDQDVANVLEIYSIPIGGGTAQKINQDPASGGDITRYEFSPDNTVVLYSGDQDTNNKTELYRAKISGDENAKLSGSLSGSVRSISGYYIINNNKVIFLDNSKNIFRSINLFTAETDNNWNDTGNWSDGIVPTNSSNALLPSTINLSVNSAVEVNDLYAFGTITVSDGNSLLVNGDYDGSLGTTILNSGSSLIVKGSSTGNITYKRNLATTDWYLVSSPVGGETIEDMISNNSFATGTGSNIGLAPYLNDGTAWDYQTSASTGSLTSGGGYAVKLSASGDVSFTGTMPVSDVGVLITSNTNALNLIGNPYPSFLPANDDADGINDDNDILSINSSDLTEQTIWFWDQSANGGVGGYTQVNQASGGMYIAPGQGFFVSSSGSNTFNFTESMQSHQSSDSFSRNSNRSSRPEIKLALTDGNEVRNTDIFYIDGTTTGWDNGYDSTMFDEANNSFALYTHLVADSQGQDLGIQSLPNEDFESMIIPVGINASVGMEINISASSVNLPAGIKIYLEDKDNNTFTLLNDSSNFRTTLASDLNGIGRFYIRTSSGALSNDNFDLNQVGVYPVDNQLRIVGVQSGIASVRMYNILGKEVLNTSFQGNGFNEIVLPNLQTGVYIVQLQSENGKLNKKVIIE